MEERNYALYVTVLGGFSIRLTGAAMPKGENPEGAALRQRGFLQYLCVYHDRPVSQEELAAALLDGSEETGDPAGILKNNLYRSRLLLESLGLPNAKELLCYRRGVYSWDPRVEITLDAEVFDELYDKFYADPGAPDLEAGRKALKVYGGDFLSSSVGGLWTLSIRTYYRGRCLKLMRDMAEVLYAQGELEESLKLCRQVTTADPYDEDSQLLLLKLFHATGQTQTAIKHYEGVRALYMEQLGISPSQPLADYYRTLNRTDEPRELDLHVIRSQLLEEEAAIGAYFCEYAVFRNIYRVIARSATRTGMAIQIAMIVLNDTKGDPLEVKRCAEAMNELHSAVGRILRSGDVFTRYSRDQFLVMLPSTSHENAALALERVLAAYRKTVSGMTTLVEYSILPVLPAKKEKEERPSGKFVPAAPWRTSYKF